jgi:hypothetical protein
MTNHTIIIIPSGLVHLPHLTEGCLVHEPRLTEGFLAREPWLMDGCLAPKLAVDDCKELEEPAE